MICYTGILPLLSVLCLRDDFPLLRVAPQDGVVGLLVTGLRVLVGVAVRGLLGVRGLVAGLRVLFGRF